MASVLPAPASTVQSYIARQPATGAAIAAINCSPAQTFFLNAFQASLATATENQVQVMVPAACTLNKLTALVDTNTLTTANATVTVRKNGADTLSLVTWTPGQTGSKSSTAQVSFAAGDLISLELSAAAGGAGAVAFQPAVKVDLTW